MPRFSFRLTVNRRIIEKATIRLQQRAARLALSLGSVAIDAMRRYCPVDTGDLRNSITGYAYGATPPPESGIPAPGVYQFVIVAGIVPGKRRYGHFVEFGTSRMAAQPFFRPGLEESRRQSPVLFSLSAPQG